MNVFIIICFILFPTIAMLLGFWGGKKYGWNLRGNHERIQEINREQEKLSNLSKIFSIILSVQSTHLTPSLEDQLKEALENENYELAAEIRNKIQNKDKS
tara:strand:- start:361 stop:660 length:300 start_codon:yes stop_codon:yes gene_type:complete